MRHTYRGNLTWLTDNTILEVTHGSHAYGLNIASSDVDIKGICIPPAEYWHGFSKVFEQAESKDPDVVIFGLRKFFKLAAECNPNIIEVLWCDPSDIRHVTPVGQVLLDNRQAFISKKARWTFSGYAMSQLKRIRGHARWLKNPPRHKPTRKEHELPEHTLIPADQLGAAQSLVEKKLGQWNLTDMQDLEPADRIRLQGIMAEAIAEMKITSDQRYESAARAIGLSDNFLVMLARERNYNSAMSDWNSYQTWLKERNPKRAADEAKHSFDTKHGMHLVRLMRMCREILETGNVIVKRPDREELLTIRRGEWTLEQLIAWADEQDAAMQALYDASPLPHHVDTNALDDICQKMVEQFLRKGSA